MDLKEMELKGGDWIDLGVGGESGKMLCII